MRKGLNLHFKWTERNAKLMKTGTVGFSIPAYRSEDGFVTCPGAQACASYCYARQGRFKMTSVRDAREFNLNLIRLRGVDWFVRAACEDLHDLPPYPTVRIHDSGDFFSQEYLEGWFEIADIFCDRTFYAYSKSRHLDWSKRPDNLQVVFSFGGKYDNLIDIRQPHSRVFANDKDRKKAGYVDGLKDDTPAMNGVIKIGLAYHGTTNLTDAQTVYLKKAAVK